uniref:TSA: Wollemia nobilis Ref_Wollemi_Transcript_6723_2396 transcribed RNA sequence n=1 Tax=Wollemia nobilis TaxID=56998 RepID=A0A0C9S9S3_9CONI
MELKGKVALVTGGGSGIGRALSLALARKGVRVTILDFSENSGKLVGILEEEHARSYKDVEKPTAIFVKCDVTNPGDLASAFAKHMEIFGRLDICINSAGIGDKTSFVEDTSTDGSGKWRRTIDVNLTALIDCTRLAIQIMEAGGHRGSILNIGSASGLYPLYNAPIYSASKGGVVMFSRSLRAFKRKGIRVNVLCPEFVETDLAKKTPPKIIELSGGYLPMDMVIKGAFELIEDETKFGDCLWITKRRGLVYWPTPEEKRKYMVSSQAKNNISRTAPTSAGIVQTIPSKFEKVVVYTLDHNFRQATKIERTNLKLPIKHDHVLLKNLYAGVNASDVNYSSGRYFGNEREALSRLPFDAGFESVGLVAAIGDSVQGLSIGAPVAAMTFGAYAEFTEIPAKHLIPVPKPDPEVVAMLTSGLTASIGLEQAGKMESGQTVLVTAAAGGTGQFAVQLAKIAGNKVVATCGGAQKETLLKAFGIDRVIDYRKEDIKLVLKEEFPKGVDIVYESVGGEMFNTCLNALAIHGRLVVIGMISQYQGERGWKPSNYTGLCEKLLFKSQSVAGFFLMHYSHLWRTHLERLYNLYIDGKLKVALDPKQFLGVKSVADAVEYLHSGQSVGKVVVCIDPTFTQRTSRL